jgi:SAM-dependent methyltransferase
MSADANAYVHGYSQVEHDRLLDQANTLAHLLHHDTRYPAGSRVLEAGCGVGAQTVILAQQSAGAHITALDISDESLSAARARVAAAGFSQVTFQQGDLYRLPFPAHSFDHVFVCFVLEHLATPARALAELGRVLTAEGTLTVIEGDHGSAYYHPASPRAQRTIDCLVQIQARMGGDALIGRALFPVLRQAGFQDVKVEPRVVYADDSRPEWVEGFTKSTFIAMVKGVKEHALSLGLIDESAWNAGIHDLERSAASDGTFNYTFFKAVARKGR